MNFLFHMMELLKWKNLVYGWNDGCVENISYCFLFMDMFGIVEVFDYVSKVYFYLML